VALNTLGSNRDQLIGLAISDRERLIDEDVLVGDPRRWRPRWFDGRFLAASDLQGEQNYVLVRQADIGRAGGAGVIDGLLVSAVREVTSNIDLIRIDPGHGITDTGELVVLFDPLTFNPADVPELQRLDAAFGLQVIPNEPGRTRTGLYVLALRPVEWTANPIAAYPTSLTGTRTVEDSTIVEGVAVSLIPYPDQGTDDGANRRRARAAREIFVEGRDHGLLSGVLPIAMVALRGNLVDWIDPFMVRRETGAERPAGMDFGFGARALREAHLLQYHQHLADALDANHDRPFPATAFMDALPPVGEFPSATLDANQLTQRFFPAGIDVALSFVPEDELPAIIEESLLLPPIDLTVGLDALTGTGVIVLVSLTRAEFTADRLALPNWDAELPRLRPVFVDVKARALPRDLLLARVLPPTPASDAPQEEEPWRQLLRDKLSNRLLWYVRRRHLPIPANVAGTPVSADIDTDNMRRLADLVIANRTLSRHVDALRAIKSAEVNSLMRRLAAPHILSDPLMLRSVVARAAGPTNTAPTETNAVVGLAHVTDPRLGQGLAVLRDRSAEITRLIDTNRIVDSGVLTEVDRLARDVPTTAVPQLVSGLRTALKRGADIPAALADLRSRLVTR
jgi:hypothetical protein